MSDQEDLFGSELHGNDLTGADFEVTDTRRWPYTLSEMLTVVANGLARDGLIQESQADCVARQVVALLAHHFGGRQFYLPKGDSLHVALRDHQIWREFNGRNHEELAERFNLSVIWIYKVIKQQKALHRARVQKELPLS